MSTAVPELCGVCNMQLDTKTAVFGFGTKRYHPECVNPVFLKRSPDEPLAATETQKRIRLACFAVADMLIAKNQSYGDSALKPIGIFAKGRALDLLNARIDDKLNRIKNAPDAFGEDPADDLIGYLILRKLALEDAQEVKP